MSQIEIDRVSKSFGGTKAVCDVSLRIAPGERLVLLGPSGAGKTSLLRMIAGLEKPDQGQIRIGDQEIHRLPPTQRRLAVVPQDYALYPQLTLRGNLETSLMKLRLSRPQISERIAATLEQFELEPLADRLPSQLSGGQAQRASFAKALVGRPEVLLLDEPLSQVDSRLKESLIGIVEQIAARAPITMLLVTHEPMQAMRLADRIAIIEAGKLLDVGTTEEVHAHPKSRVAGQLTGLFGMNWMPAQTVSPQAHQPFVGFRPEHFEVGSALDSTDGLDIEAEVIGCQHLGVGYLCRVNWAEQVLKLWLPPGACPPAAGETLKGQVQARNLCYVDK